MIVELSLNNFAIIDNLKINLEKGFNVLTGETGAGKSIIVEGIGMLLGQRANKNFVKTGQEKAILEGMFYLEEPDTINNILLEQGIDADSENNLIISREIYNNGRSVSRVNGRIVTLTILNNITTNLVDIHGQHEHQSLLNVDNHIKLVDSFGNAEFKNLLNSIEKKYELLKTYNNKVKELSLNTVEREREIDLLEYQLNDIQSLNIEDINEDEITSEYNKLDNIKDIMFNLEQVFNIVNGDDYNESYSILESINACRNSLNSIEDFDNTIKEYDKVFESIQLDLQDISRNIRNYLNNTQLDDEELSILKDKIDSINSLKMKYGNTIEDIIKYRDSIKDRLNTLLNNEKFIEETNKKIKQIEKDLYGECTKLTDLRKNLSNNIEYLITKELKEMNMNNVKFKINFDRYKYFTPKGWDKIEFLISTNKGENLKPLAKIISGGEMSRIMLAFKKILANYDNVYTLIFDEIDTGISGRTAQIVGEKIKSISQNHQVICISHLPQIAALADVHFLIEKQDNEKETQVIVRKLDYNEQIQEISRLIGGVNLTNTTKLHAQEMIDMSKKMNFNK